MSAMYAIVLSKASDMNSHRSSSGLRPKSIHCGFTLIELLVVIGIIGILAGLLLPVLARGKERAKMAKCLSNYKQLQLAWMNYADDNQQQLVLSTSGVRNSSQSWAGGWMSYYNRNNPDNADAALFTDYLLKPYIDTPQIFKCPSDPHDFLVRTASMNGYVGGYYNGGWWHTLPATHQYYRAYTTTDMFAAPSEIFVFLDENWSNINDCLFVPATPPMPGNKAADAQWTDMPASYHMQSGVFSFADGHVESRRWSDSAILNGAHIGTAPTDSAWLFQHMTELK